MRFQRRLLRVDDEGASGEIRLTSIAEGDTDPIPSDGLGHVIVHDLKGSNGGDSTGRKQLNLIMHSDSTALNVTDGHESDALDVEVLVDRDGERTPEVDRTVRLGSVEEVLQ